MTGASDQVLLVEDDYLLAFPIEMSLGDLGFAVTVVHGGNEALNVLHRQASAFSAIVTDVRLGAGPNGWEVARRARELNRALTVVYMTADSSAEWTDRGVHPSHLLRKPFMFDEMAALLSDPERPAARLQ